MRGFLAHGIWCWLCGQRYASQLYGVRYFSYAQGSYVTRWLCRECYRDAVRTLKQLKAAKL
jgi:hypothetical protein